MEREWSRKIAPTDADITLPRCTTGNRCILRRSGVEGVAAAPATAGELVQGWPGGVALQVAAPVDRFAVARVRLPGGAGRLTGPATSPRAREAAALALARAGMPLRAGRLTLRSPIPRGVGMGSSTADLAAAAAAGMLAAGRRPHWAVLAALLPTLEPTNGVMIPGLGLYAHRDGSVAESLGPPPPALLVVVDPGVVVDTLAFHRGMPPPPSRERDARWLDAFRGVREGIAQGELRLVGEASTLSARTNQALLPNPLLPAALKLARRWKAAGVLVGHSGSCVSFLLPPDGDRARAMADALRSELRGVRRVLVHRLVGGGVRLAPEGPLP